MRQQIEYHVFADNVLVAACAGFVDAGTTARAAAFRAPGVLFTVARVTGDRHAIQVARFQVVGGVWNAWVR
jgi:hypothetical protein